MNERLIKLIELVNKIELLRAPETKLRDRQYEVCWTHNYGDPYFYVAHDGFLWSIDQYLPPSQNQFESLDKAVNALWRVLIDRFKTVYSRYISMLSDKYYNSPWSKEELEEMMEEFEEIVSDED